MRDDDPCEWLVCSCSSESDVHAASNALRSELYRKWQTADPADEAWLLLEVRPPSAVSKLEIVNAGTSLIEVFGLPDDCSHQNADDVEDKYAMLLSAQQLMSSKDVINKANRNRTFTYTCNDKLLQVASQRRWKRFKVVCRQPFGSEEHKSCIGLSRLNFQPCMTVAEVDADAAEARLQQNLKAGLAKMFPQVSSSTDCEVVSRVTEPSRFIQTSKEEEPCSSYAAESLSPVRGKRKLPTWQSPSKHSKNGDGSKGKAVNHKDAGSDEEEVGKVSQKGKVERPKQRDALNSSKQSKSSKVGEPKKRAFKSGKTRSPSRSESPERKETMIESETGCHPESREKPSTAKRKPSQITKSASTQGSVKHSRKALEPKVDCTSQSKQTSSSSRIHQPESSTEVKESCRSQRHNEVASTSSKNSKKHEQNFAEAHNSSQAVTEPIFSKLLDGVIFAISGFVNPDRAEIRDKALEMGAQYQPDWSDECTLLICAFAKTPKFNQVQGANGTIVSKVWIQECYAQKKLVDIEKYLMHVGKPWRKLGLSIMAESDEESLPYKLGCHESSKTLASLQEIEKWVHEDVASSIAWLKQQETQPKAEELESIAIQGILMCLDDAVECLRNKQSIKTIMETWDFVPRAVQELSMRESKAEKAKTRSLWSDLLCEVERLKWIYSKQLQSMSRADVPNVEQVPINDEDDDTDVMPDDYSSEDTELLDEDDISEAKEAISKMISSLT